MTAVPYHLRAEIAATIDRHQQEVAETVTAEFFERHPDWKDRYGQAGWQHGIDDACFHMRFLAGSIASGAAVNFSDYLRWTARLLNARGMHTDFLIENVRQIEHHLAPLLSEDAARMMRDQVDSALTALDVPVPEGSVDSGIPGGYQLTCSLFTQALIQGDRTAALNIVLEALKNGAAPEDLYVDVLQNALYAVGKRWETNEITVAQEHLATAIAQYVISALYQRLPPSEETRGNAVITGTKGEQHQVGAMMLSDMLELDGWNVRFLGTNMPAKDIAEAVASHEAQVLGISVTILFSIPRVRELIELCRAQDKNNQLRIIVGGQAFRSTPGLYQEVGADAFAPDLRAAREVMRNWA